MDSPDHMASIEDLLRHRDWVRAVARTLVWAGQDADDLEQQTWLSAVEAPPRDESPRGWLATVLRRKASRFARTEARRHAREQASAGIGKIRTPAEIVAETELHERVVRSVLALDEPYREAILLRFYEGLPAS